MNINDCIDQEFYVCDYFVGSYCFIFDKRKSHRTWHVSDDSKSLSPNGAVFNSKFEKDIKNLRFATPKEKKWLLECIRLNKYIPLNEIKVIENVESFKIF